MRPFGTSGGEEAFWALARRVLDGVSPPPDRKTLVEDCGRLLARQPASTRAAVAAFLQLLRLSSLVRRGRPFERLDAKTQDRVLARLQRTPLKTVRAGFWGLRTLALVAYYGRPETPATIGYRPSWLTDHARA